MTHGGARPGAGRPRLPRKARAPRATLPAAAAAALARLRSRWACSAPEAIRRAVLLADKTPGDPK